jgi:hypothetical protein
LMGFKQTKFKLMKDHGNKENLVIKKLTSWFYWLGVCVKQISNTTWNKMCKIRTEVV